MGTEVGLASAVKMSTASVYKGTAALLTHALLAAQTNGVLAHVLDDLRHGVPELLDGAAPSLARAATKAGRYVGEMRTGVGALSGTAIANTGASELRIFLSRRIKKMNDDRMPWPWEEHGIDIGGEG